MSRTSSMFAVPLLPTCALLAGCATSQLTWRLLPSVIEPPNPKATAIQVPDSAMAGAPMTIVVWTKGGGCMRKGRTEVTQRDRVATIRLFDSVLVRQPDDYACPSVLWFARNVFVVQFSHPGAGVVRVMGTDTLERTLVVR